MPLLPLQGHGAGCSARGVDEHAQRTAVAPHRGRRQQAAAEGWWAKGGAWAGRVAVPCAQRSPVCPAAWPPLRHPAAPRLPTSPACRRAADLLENLLNGSTFWRPSILMGAHIELQAVQLGSVGGAAGERLVGAGDGGCLRWGSRPPLHVQHVHAQHASVAPPRPAHPACPLPFRRRPAPQEPPRITGAKCFRQHTTRVDEVGWRQCAC